MLILCFYCTMFSSVLTLTISVGVGRRNLTTCAVVVELVDTLDSKSGEHYARAGSSPAHGTSC